jgi:hypothetical protein
MNGFVYTLTELQYSTDRKGPFVLYVYGHNGYHSGSQYFNAPSKMSYGDEKITWESALKQTIDALGDRREIRICDVGDNLVFHAKGKNVLYGEGFWKEVSGG